MNKGDLSNITRGLGLIFYLDKIRFYFQKIKNRKVNSEFRLKHPGVVLPPDYLMYESFQVHFDKYYTGGLETARWLKTILTRHSNLDNKRILDWGCGPGRVARHLPTAFGSGCTYFATDYNPRSIEWCTNNLPGINFNHNSLAAKLPYPDSFFDIIYGLSIFTHLSEKSHHEWLEELTRVLKPGGIMLLTTHGNNFRVKLTRNELNQFNDNRLVVRGKVKEGHRTYTAFHPAGYMRDMFQHLDILEHIETKPYSGKWLPQDTWVVIKPK